MFGAEFSACGKEASSEPDWASGSADRTGMGVELG